MVKNNRKLSLSYLELRVHIGLTLYKLFNDLEFWNVLTLKTETFLIELGRVRSDKRRFELIEKNLSRYLKTKD